VTPPTIRQARADDVPALSELAKRTWADAFAHSVSPEDAAAELATTRSEAHFLAALREHTILVADAGGALVGYVAFGPVDIPEVDPEPGDRALRRLYVDSAWHGRGVGRRLIDAAFEHPGLRYARRVYVTVWEENRRAVRLYERLGFRRVGTTRFAIGSEAVEDLIMVRDQR
jgi:ribosomal protein S18 acetylase RimI-like enzyme